MILYLYLSIIIIFSIITGIIVTIVEKRKVIFRHKLENVNLISYPTRVNVKFTDVDKVHSYDTIEEIPTIFEDCNYNTISLNLLDSTKKVESIAGTSGDDLMFNEPVLLSIIDEEIL